MTEEMAKLAEKIDRLARTARGQDLALMLSQSELQRISRVAAVIESLGKGTYLAGSGPYTQGVYSVMADEVILGRQATPLEKPLGKPVDIFCQDVISLTPREVSRQHAMINREGGESWHYFIRDLNSSCGTFVNGERLATDNAAYPLKHGDVISLGPSHINTYVFMELN